MKVLRYYYTGKISDAWKLFCRPKLFWNLFSQPIILIFQLIIYSWAWVKVGVNIVNRSEIRSNFKKELLGLKWCRNTTRMLTLPLSPFPPPPPPKKRESEFQVGKGLFGVYLVILLFKFQFSKSIKSSTLHIFLSLTYHLRKNSSFPKCPKNSPKNLPKLPNIC